MSFQNVNKIMIIGNLGHEPELRKTPKGNTVLTLSLATNRQIKLASGETRSETHWHRATLWGKSAENAARILKKGARVYLEGELHMKSWADKDGVPRKSAEIYVDTWQHLGHAGPSQPEPGAPAARPELALVH
jgi:single-strand DNA-binding protein